MIEWTKDLIDELAERSDLLPCKNLDRLGDCVSRQKRYLVVEMKPSKMCTRCRARWHIMVGLAAMQEVHSAKTQAISPKMAW